MRYLLDTCVLVSALRSSAGASYNVLKAALDGSLPVLMHYKMLAAYRSVLFRPEHLSVISQTEYEIERLLSYLVAIAVESNVRYLWRPNLGANIPKDAVMAILAKTPAVLPDPSDTL